MYVFSTDMTLQLNESIDPSELDFNDPTELDFSIASRKLWVVVKGWQTSFGFCACNIEIHMCLSCFVFDTNFISL